MTTEKTLYVNGDLIRGQLLALGMSERDLSRKTGIGEATIRNLLRRNQAQTSLTIAQVQALAAEVGLTVAEALTPNTPIDAPRDGDDRAHRLIAVLRHEQRIIPWDHLVDAFGWSIKELRLATGTANHCLQGTGLRVHIAGTGLALRAEEQPVRDVIAVVDRLRARDESMDNSTARILFEVVTGTIAQALVRQKYLPRLGYLRNQGMIHVGRPGDMFIIPSEEVMFAFDV